MKRLCIAEVTAARKASLCPVGSSVVESSVHDTHRPNPADEMTRRVAYNVIHTLVSRNKGNERANLGEVRNEIDGRHFLLFFLRRVDLIEPLADDMDSF